MGEDAVKEPRARTAFPVHIHCSIQAPNDETPVVASPVHHPMPERNLERGSLIFYASVEPPKIRTPWRLSATEPT